MSEQNLTSSRVRNLLCFDPATGIFTWRIARRGVSIGAVAGYVNNDGYTHIRVDGHLYMSHRLAWLYTHGEWPDCEIDHQNGVRTDNRICNLRVVTCSEQKRNAKLQSNNASGVVGVCWHKRAGKWRAQINAEGRHIHLGLFEDFDKAVAARKAAEIKHNYHPNHGLTAEQRANASRSTA